jgi:hypothetical protein
MTSTENHGPIPMADAPIAARTNSIPNHPPRPAVDEGLTGGGPMVRNKATRTSTRGFIHRGCRGGVGQAQRDPDRAPGRGRHHPGGPHRPSRPLRFQSREQDLHRPLPDHNAGRPRSRDRLPPLPPGPTRSPGDRAIDVPGGGLASLSPTHDMYQAMSVLRTVAVCDLARGPDPIDSAVLAAAFPIAPPMQCP